MRIPIPITGLLSLFLLVLHFLGAIASYCQATALGERQTLSLQACLQMAMEKNYSRPASRFAVAVAEALTAESEGPERGATFTLELPLQAQEAASYRSTS
jgi:hypothetical protein